jgi:hypothetical protein
MDRPVRFSIDFESSKAGDDATLLAAELTAELRPWARDRVGSSAKTRRLVVEVDIASSPSLFQLANVLSAFIHRHKTRFVITTEKHETLFLHPNMDAERIAADIFSALPGDPTIDPPKPRKRGR